VWAALGLLAGLMGVSASVFPSKILSSIVSLFFGPKPNRTNIAQYFYGLVVIILYTGIVYCLVMIMLFVVDGAECQEEQVYIVL
jgi:phosphotransferase system  glucose/maltose/N-acetylglucosamine-specific IIC component